jgi:methyl coenzyme M reductase gamma subunit
MNDERAICPECKLVMMVEPYAGSAEGIMIRHILFSHTIPEYIRELLYEQEKHNKKE